MSTQVAAYELADLCAICASVDFEGAVDHASKNFDWTSATYTLHEYHTLDSKCPLCKVFLALIHDGDGQRQREVSIELHRGYSYPITWLDMKLPVFRLNNCNSPWWVRGSVFWQKLDAKVIHPINANVINFDAINAALQLCRETHASCLTSRSDDNPFFKLIDCKTREVVLGRDLLHQDYAALSYVWGQLHHELKHSGNLPKILPATIEDAIQVTLKLGLKYLWIDRYCIDQDNEVELSAQIGSMDAIYHNAAITIIAACGQDPSHGLPRVSGKAHETTWKWDFTVGNIHFFHAHKNTTAGRIGDKINKSRWNERAWTYQEAFFSRRRLVFTEDEVYLDCLETVLHELFDLKEAPRLDQELPQILQKQYAGKNTDQLTVLEHISQYSGRSLKYPEDVIRALSGILHIFEVDVGVAHHWGIPLPKQQSQPLIQWGTVEAFFLGLLWRPVRGWHYLAPRRRLFAPSWSWAGWEEQVRWLLNPTKFTVDPQADFKIEMLDGRILGWEEFLTYDMTVRQSLASHFVHLTVSSVSFQIKPSTGPKSFSSWHEAQVLTCEPGQDDTFVFEFQEDTELSSGRTYEALHLGYTNRALKKILDVPLMLIFAERHGRLERIGRASLLLDDIDKTSENFQRYNKIMRRSLRTLRIG